MKSPILAVLLALGGLGWPALRADDYADPVLVVNNGSPGLWYLNMDVDANDKGSFSVTVSNPGYRNLTAPALVPGTDYSILGNGYTYTITYKIDRKAILKDSTGKVLSGPKRFFSLYAKTDKDNQPTVDRTLVFKLRYPPNIELFKVPSTLANVKAEDMAAKTNQSLVIDPTTMTITLNKAYLATPPPPKP